MKFVYLEAGSGAPPDLVSAIITEKGVVTPPYTENIRKILGISI